MKILLIQHLYFFNGTGGTEKICCFLANHFVNKGHQVEIATNENISGTAMFSLEDQVKIKNIYDSNVDQKIQIPIYNYSGKNPFLWLIYKIKKKYAKLYNIFLKAMMRGEENLFIYNLEQRSKAWKSHIDQSNPDLIITMSISSLLEITFKNEMTIPIIDSVNGRPDYDYTNIFGGRKPFEVKLLKDSFQHLAGVQILFDSYREYLPDSFKGKIAVISNPVPKIDNSINHFATKDRYKVIHIARLDIACKQQHLAIEIFSKLASKYPNWDFELWGIGSDFHKLNRQIIGLNLKDRVCLKGYTGEPIVKLCGADIFIFPSKYEGFGLALAEAMSVGLPCIGFRSCSGVNELINHDQTGFLAESTHDMIQFLDQLMEDKYLRYRLGRQAKIDINEYSEEKVDYDWQEFIKTVLLSSNHATL